MIVPSGYGSFPSRKALIATSLPRMARRSLLLPASWATEITLQSRYPEGIVTPKIGDASLGRPAANEMAGMTHAVIAANTQEIRFMQVPRRLTTRISIDIN